MGYNGKNDEVSGIISTAIHHLINKDLLMNRKKKLSQIHQKRVKAAKAKGSTKKKSPYISKAERAKLDVLAESENSTSVED